jgi:hypothetical protein
VSISDLYTECVDAARECTKRAHRPEDAEGDGYPGATSKSYAQAALALTQAAVTISKASHERRVQARRSS